MTAFFNTGLTQQDFLNHYWQKKPLLIRGAFSDFVTPVTPDDLAGLACEPEIESRLIQEHGPNGSWDVQHGPFDDDVFSTLPATHWTLLVQDVDKHLPETQWILDPFRFIPDWRRDDLMISYAPDQGTVGPHTDGYDVFLIQAMGHRRWQIGDEPMIKPDIIHGLPVQILKDFAPADSWDLEPGDILYLPPHYAHHGVALDDCMTFSVGFRAPSQTDMLDAVVNGLLEHQLATGRYEDPNLQCVESGAEIDENAVARLKMLLHKTIDDSAPILAEILGKYVSETKSSLLDLAEEGITDEMDGDELTAYFEQGGVLQRSLYLRFAWTAHREKIQLFMAGEAYELPLDVIGLMPLLTDAMEITFDEWQQLQPHEAVVEVLCQLIAQGGWIQT
jgi:50S ribosomal protein L16 3-hydroxylase